MVSKAYEPDLIKKTFNFTDEDLAVNQKGKISSNQHKYLKGRLVGDLRHQVGIIGMWAFIVSIFTLLIALFNVVAWIPAFLLTVATVFMYVYALALIKEDLKEGEVASICGLSRLEKRISGRTGNYYIEVEKERFRLTQLEYLYLENEVWYCLYYLPKTRAILSIRSITDNE